MIEFKLPSLGADMDTGTMLEWHVQPGDVVKRGQVVAVVDTSKAAVDVESWQEGRVGALLVQPKRKIPVGTTLALLLEAGEGEADVARWQREHPQAEAAPTAQAQPVTVAAPQPVPGGGHVAASPVARRRALELDVRLESVTGTGPHGAITLQDVEQAAARAALPVDRQAEMRRAIAAAMSRSKREIPHYYLAETIPMARALVWLAEANAGRAMAERLLPAALLVKAVALALKRTPELNGFVRDGVFQRAEHIHPGVAISLRQGGLLAPALLDADRKNVAQLMHELTDLVARTRAGSLRSSEMGEATITLTNLGDQGIESVFGVIYPPQVALVGFGRICERPWVADGKLVAMPLLSASLSADHRVSDGHRGALFLAELRELLQEPESLNEATEGKSS